MVLCSDAYVIREALSKKFIASDEGELTDTLELAIPYKTRQEAEIRKTIYNMTETQKPSHYVVEPIRVEKRYYGNFQKLTGSISQQYHAYVVFEQIDTVDDSPIYRVDKDFHNNLEDKVYTSSFVEEFKQNVEPTLVRNFVN